MIKNPAVQWHQVVPTTVTLTGAAGFVDLDFSAVMPGSGVALVQASSGGDSGIRATGSSLNTLSALNLTSLVRVVDGHCEGYRDVAGNSYTILGWFDGS